MGTFNFQEKYDIGYPIFSELFQLKDLELKEKLKDIIGEELKNQESLYILNPNTGVTREIHNEKYRKITIEFYNWIEITPFGIDYHPEHGRSQVIRLFDKHFKL